MCGIFGVLLKRNTKLDRGAIESIVNRLFLLSESRGKESAGIHAWLPNRGEAWTVKSALPATEFILTDAFREALARSLDIAFPVATDANTEPLALLAHSRLVTNGTAALAQNNQPVRSGRASVIHNGIVVNVDELWSRHPHLHRRAEVDTEVLAAFIDAAVGEGLAPSAATRQIYGQLTGAASIAWVHDGIAQVTLATNTGDLYYASDAESQLLIFASERYILEQVLLTPLRSGVLPSAASINWLEAGHAVEFDLAGAFGVQPYGLKTGSSEIARAAPHHGLLSTSQHHDRDIGTPPSFDVLRQTTDDSLLRYAEDRIRAMRRCSRCVLPETFPFIHFDASGVCNYCRKYRPHYAGKDLGLSRQNFVNALERYRRIGSTPDVIVPFSGGRDSCYGLHLIKKEFGFRPVTFTYDWGMVTDLARRNIARFCGELGVQNILVSADIKQKRENIRKNVSAWLKRPDLGMIPLFMAGDKHFFKIMNTLKRQLKLDLNIWSANPLENTDFKVGLTGISPKSNKKRVDHLSLLDKGRLLVHYGIEFLSNPGYLNSSLLDTASAFGSYYFEPRQDFYSLFHHIEWEEECVNRLIIDTYDFERAPDSPSTWRIGDGTAPFYNYIYITALGFSEFDTFRSNQIREGQISRTEALERVVIENRPRAEGLRWYLTTIDLDFNDTVREINKLDKLRIHA
jgi:glutamine---fructose-6-phosphate transaminase (isomerizing)